MDARVLAGPVVGCIWGSLSFTSKSIYMLDIDPLCDPVAESNDLMQVHCHDFILNAQQATGELILPPSLTFRAPVSQLPLSDESIRYRWPCNDASPCRREHMALPAWPAEALKSNVSIQPRNMAYVIDVQSQEDHAM